MKILESLNNSLFSFLIRRSKEEGIITLKDKEERNIKAKS